MLTLLVSIIHEFKWWIWTTNKNLTKDPFFSPCISLFVKGTGIRATRKLLQFKPTSTNCSHCSGICNTHKMERRLEVPYLIPGEATLRINTFHRLLSRGIISCTVESRWQQAWLDVQMRSVGSLTSGPLKSLFHLSTIFVPVCFLLKAFDERNAMMTKEWETGTRWWNSSGWFSWHRHIAQSPSLKFGKYKTFCDWKHFYPLRVHLQVVSLLPCTQSK